MTQGSKRSFDLPSQNNASKVQFNFKRALDALCCPYTAHRSILIGEGTHTILSAFDYVLWHKQLSDRVLPLTFVLVIYCANKYNSI